MSARYQSSTILVVTLTLNPIWSLRFGRRPETVQQFEQESDPTDCTPPGSEGPPFEGSKWMAGKSKKTGGGLEGNYTIGVT